MKKLVLSVVTLTATPLLAVAVGVGPTHADPQRDGAAQIIRGALCFIRTNPGGSNFATTTDMKAVVAPNGQVNLVCHGQVDAGSVDPFQASGFVCGLGPFGT